jgi:hypothetical protein
LSWNGAPAIEAPRLEHDRWLAVVANAIDDDDDLDAATLAQRLRYSGFRQNRKHAPWIGRFTQDPDTLAQRLAWLTEHPQVRVATLDAKDTSLLRLVPAMTRPWAEIQARLRAEWLLDAVRRDALLVVFRPVTLHGDPIAFMTELRVVGKNGRIHEQDEILGAAIALGMTNALRSYWVDQTMRAFREACMPSSVGLWLPSPAVAGEYDKLRRAARRIGLDAERCIIEVYTGTPGSFHVLNRTAECGFRIAVRPPLDGRGLEDLVAGFRPCFVRVSKEHAADPEGAARIAATIRVVSPGTRLVLDGAAPPGSGVASVGPVTND